MKTFQELKKKAKKAVPSFPTVRVALLGDTATQLLGIALKGMAIEHGYNLDLWEADYNQIALQIGNPLSEYHTFRPQYTILFQSTHRLLEHYNRMGWEQKKHLAEERIANVDILVSEAEGKIIYLNYPEIGDNVFGSYGSQIRESFIYQQRKLNFELMNYASEHAGFYLCDIADIQNREGRKFMFDANIYNSTEMILSISSLPWVAARILDVICAIEGRFKKCLILDLDNTLWGGVVGDDGWENIQIGHGLGIGKAYSELQCWIKQLKERGIILAVCSKNDEAVAKEVFMKNPEMILSLDDIAVFVANWDNKADNIRLIQRTLNVGFDSMVFLDDNPFERNMVRENIPGIMVPELPEDPADYLEFLYGQNLFETATYSAGDIDRTKQYQIEAQRSLLHHKFTNEEDFLQSLEMVAEVCEFNSFNIPRVAQLSQRSNQFNLRTIRYDENDIKRIAEDRKAYASFAFSLRDKFGDNGLISVVILEKIDQYTLFVDTWFMSCRVLKRGMEYFVLSQLVDYAKNNGFASIVGEYLPTQKNKMVETHYVSLGFVPMTGFPNRFVLNIDNYQPVQCYIKKS